MWITAAPAVTKSKRLVMAGRKMLENQEISIIFSFS